MLTMEVFKLGIENLKQNFPDANFTKLKYEIWFKELRNRLTSEEFEEAVNKAIFELRQCPTGKELLNLVKASERELVTEAWARVLDALSRRLSLNELDTASQYAIARLGGTSLLETLPMNKLQEMRYEFANHWNSFRKNPKDFTPPVQTITPEQREFTSLPPSEDEYAPRTPEQKANAEKVKKELYNLKKGMSISERMRKFLPPEEDTIFGIPQFAVEDDIEF